MFSGKGKATGFTMVELLVVLLIVGILAAVATPLYLAHTRRARASEAIAAMSLMRQAEREYFVKHNAYRTIAGADLANDPEAAANPGLDITLGVTQYFAPSAYAVTVGGGSARFTNPTAVDFLITASGAAAANTACAAGVTTACAVHTADVTGYAVEMDNSGRIFFDDGSGAGFRAW